MASIRFVSTDDVDFVRSKEFAADRSPAEVSEEELLGTAVRMRHPGADGELQLFEVRCEPGVRVAPHSHAADEIVYVVEGEMRFGNRRCGPGTSIHIRGESVYAFAAGPAGCTFLNFRASGDLSYFTQEHALARRRAAKR